MPWQHKVGTPHPNSASTHKIQILWEGGEREGGEREGGERKGGEREGGERKGGEREGKGEINDGREGVSCAYIA